MFQIWQVTAEFSNAVLIAILPFVADFAKKLELPGNYSTNALLEFHCDPRVGPMAGIGGRLIFTNHYEFWFDHGYVKGFRNRHSYYELQDPADIPKFFGKATMTEGEALAFARNKIEGLGYSLAEVYADQPPKVSPPVVARGGVVPHYLFEWFDPLLPGDWGQSVHVEVNAEARRIENLRLFLPREAWREPPKISPQILARRPPGPPLPAAFGPVNTNVIVESILGRVPDYIKRMALPVKPPILAEVRKLSRYDYLWENSVRLTNGWTFLTAEDRIVGFIAPKCFFRYEISADWPRSARHFIGKWNLSEADARRIAEAAVRRADPTNTTFLLKREPEVTKTTEIGIYVIPRFLFEWSERKTRSQAQVEIDASDGTVRYLYVLASLLPSPDPLPEPVPRTKITNLFE